MLGVSGVKIDGKSVTDYTVRRSVLERAKGWPRGLTRVEVTYSHGWALVDDPLTSESESESEGVETIPAIILLGSLNCARRTYNGAGTDEDGTVNFEQIGSYSYRLADGSLADVGLTKLEERSRAVPNQGRRLDSWASGGMESDFGAFERRARELHVHGSPGVREVVGVATREPDQALPLQLSDVPGLDLPVQTPRD